MHAPQGPFSLFMLVSQVTMPYGCFVKLALDINTFHTTLIGKDGAVQ